MLGKGVQHSTQPGAVRHHQQAPARAAGRLARQCVEGRAHGDMARLGICGEHLLDQIRQRQLEPRRRKWWHRGSRQQHIAGRHDQDQALGGRQFGDGGVAFAQQLPGRLGALPATTVGDGRADQGKRQGAEVPGLRLVVRPMRQADVQGGAQDFLATAPTMASMNDSGGM